MSFEHVTSFLPIVVFILLMLLAIYGGYKSVDTEAIKALKESAVSDEGKEGRFLMYNLFIEKLTKQLENTDDEELKERIATNLKALKEDKQSMIDEINKEDDEVLKAINRTQNKKIRDAVLGQVMSFLIPNIGFIILLLTGGFMGVIVSIITFVGYAIMAESSLRKQEDFIELNSPTSMALLYGGLNALVVHIPFFLALIMWS